MPVKPLILFAQRLDRLFHFACCHALAKLFHTTASALSTGKGFKISDPPEAKPVGAQMSKRSIQELKSLLPVLNEGEILQVDTGSKDSELVALRDALAALRTAKKEGRPVWLVIGSAAGKKK